MADVSALLHPLRVYKVCSTRADSYQPANCLVTLTWGLGWAIGRPDFEPYVSGGSAGARGIVLYCSCSVLFEYSVLWFM